MKTKTVEWVVIGGGGTGIFLAEMLTRNGHEVLLIEKNAQLAQETSKDFHEWLHMGSLYSLVPDGLKTLKYVTGAIDDLLDYYSCFQNQNLIATQNGIRLKGASEKTGWFTKRTINFKYKRRLLNAPWSLIASRSAAIINKLNTHDWLRRRLGIESEFKPTTAEIYNMYKEYISAQGEYFLAKTSDRNFNSRNLLNDLLLAAINTRNLTIKLNTSVNCITSNNDDSSHEILTNSFKVLAENVVVCAGDNVHQFRSTGLISRSYAPITIVKNIPKYTGSFVLLDYNPNNCANLLVKEDGYGLAGGYTYPTVAAATKHVDDYLKKLRRYLKFDVVKTYYGVKTEYQTLRKRSYLYGIDEIMPGMWTVIPGKFSLLFTVAPEFYRRVYLQNPRKNLESFVVKSKITNWGLISPTHWAEEMAKGR